MEAPERFDVLSNDLGVVQEYIAGRSRAIRKGQAA